jgi:energy-coupling factor transporter transmembrane protein EcfT
MRPLQGMDPLVVFLGLLLVSILAFAVTDLAVLLIVLGATVSLALSYRAELGRYGRSSKGLIQMVMVIALLQLLLYRGGTPWRVGTPVGDVTLMTAQGMEMAGRIAARVGILLTSSLVFNAAVTSNRFIDALGRLRAPFVFILALDISLRAVPRMLEDAAEIKDAFIMVDRRRSKGGPLRGWSTYLHMVKPLFLAYMEKAWKLGTSLELRGFRSRPRRKRSTYRPHWKDATALLVYAAMVLFLVMEAVGSIPSLSWAR